MIFLHLNGMSSQCHLCWLDLEPTAGASYHLVRAICRQINIIQCIINGCTINMYHTFGLYESPRPSYSGMMQAVVTHDVIWFDVM